MSGSNWSTGPNVSSPLSLVFFELMSSSHEALTLRVLLMAKTTTEEPPQHQELQPETQAPGTQAATPRIKNALIGLKDNV